MNKDALNLTAEELKTKMFGCTEAELKAYIDDRLLDGDKPRILAMLILSDAQAALAPDNIIETRQFINRAKWMIANYWPT